MFDLSQEFIQQELNDPRIPWTDRQQEMLSGMVDYLGTVESNFEDGIDGLYNPGQQEVIPIPEEDTNGES